MKILIGLREKKNKKKPENKRFNKSGLSTQNILKNSGYMNPNKKSQILPQFFADKEKNLRLAQIFSIPIVKLRNQPYESRLQDWAINVISGFGDTVSEPRYREWATNNILTYNHPNEKTQVINTIAARMFFTDLHWLAIKMPNGRRFVTDLLHKVWDLIDAEAEGIDEEEFNSSALTHCYKLSANDCIKEDSLTKAVAIYVRPEVKTLNRLADQFCIALARKGKNRDKIPETMTVSYYCKERFELIQSRTAEEPPIPKRNSISSPINDKVTDQKEDTDPFVIPQVIITPLVIPMKIPEPLSRILNPQAPLEMHP